MLTDKEYQIILDFDWTGVDLRKLILEVKGSSPATDALNTFTMNPKEQLLTQIFRKMSIEDIGIAEQKLYSTKPQTRTNDIFIIHSNLDDKIAEALEIELKSIFGGKLCIFNASNPNGIKGGKDWFNHIVEQHRNSKLGLAIFTENALTNIWVAFETGGFFLRKDSSVIPLFFDSEVLEKLNFPLKGIQGKKLWEISFRKSLFIEIADKLGIKTYKYDDEQFCKNVLEIYSQQKSGKILSKDTLIKSRIKNYIVNSFLENSVPVISTQEIYNKVITKYQSEKLEIGIDDISNLLEDLSDEGRIRKISIDGETQETTAWRVLK